MGLRSGQLCGRLCLLVLGDFSVSRRAFSVCSMMSRVFMVKMLLLFINLLIKYQSESVWPPRLARSQIQVLTKAQL